MSEFISYDPRRGVTTRNGIQGDLVISALQKSIRRGLTEEAVTFAYEMYITSLQFSKKVVEWNTNYRSMKTAKPDSLSYSIDSSEKNLKK